MKLKIQLVFNRLQEVLQSFRRKRCLRVAPRRTKR